MGQEKLTLMNVKYSLAAWPPTTSWYQSSRGSSQSLTYYFNLPPRNSDLVQPLQYLPLIHLILCQLDICKI